MKGARFALPGNRLCKSKRFLEIAPMVVTLENAAHATETTPKARRRVRPVASQNVSLSRLAIEHETAFVPADGIRSRSYLCAKRCLDIVGALALLTVLAPVMLTVFAVLTVTTNGKALFFQKRLGHQGKPFWMIKFRTMIVDAHKKQAAIENEKDGPIFKNRRDPRITPLGAFLRSTSLDETPQLLSVLFGQMSLVGPRPPIAKEVVQYEWWQQQRLSVKPGLTCLWQVSGRSEIGFVDWVRMDLWYVKNQGLWTDLLLLIKTPVAVLARRGAY
jgi:lipopolysaccharide/colanic/teichoic acid biosynthesis glycosyltransferase